MTCGTRILKNLFQTLMPIRFSLSFCDHYIVNSALIIQLRRTLGAGSVGAQEGVYQPFCEIGLVHQAIPAAAAAVIRKM